MHCPCNNNRVRYNLCKYTCYNNDLTKRFCRGNYVKNENFELEIYGKQNFENSFTRFSTKFLQCVLRIEFSLESFT